MVISDSCSHTCTFSVSKKKKSPEKKCQTRQSKNTSKNKMNNMTSDKSERPQRTEEAQRFGTKIAAGCMSQKSKKTKKKAPDTEIVSVAFFWRDVTPSHISLDWLPAAWTVRPITPLEDPHRRRRIFLSFFFFAWICWKMWLRSAEMSRSLTWHKEVRSTLKGICDAKLILKVEKTKERENK